MIYHLYVRSFKDSNGDGNGDLAGLLLQLDYLSETLLVDALWLSPVYPSPMIDGGYDVTDHSGIELWRPDPSVGPIEDDTCRTPDDRLHAPSSPCTAARSHPVLDNGVGCRARK